MTKKLMKSVNNLILKEGDRIRLVGKRPPNPVVGYVSEMDELLRNTKDRIYRIFSLKYCRTTNSPIIHVAGWNWDYRNIYKVSDEEYYGPEPVLFDIKNLDL